MAATLTVRVQTTTSPGSMSQAQTGIDLVSVDNSTNTLVNRQTNPIVVPSGATSQFSMQKWLKLSVDVAPANLVTNFKAWCAGAGSVETGVTLVGSGGVVSYTTPVAASYAAAAVLPATSGAAIVWDASGYSTLGNVTQYLVLNLVVLSTAPPGNIPQQTISYSYDET